MDQGKRVRGGYLVAQALAAQQVEVVFTLSGGFTIPVLEGLMLHGIRTINTPHEQVAGHLADAWARIDRHPAVCLVGPEGFANAVPAMLEAYGQRSPVVFITGSSTMKRLNQAGFKEIDHVRIAEPLTKHSVLVTDGRHIPDFVHRAFDIAATGNPGPVHLSIPTDILYSSFDLPVMRGERPFDLTPCRSRRVLPDPERLSEAERILSRAKRPVIIAGNGVWWSKAERQLAEFASRCSIPLLLVPYHQPMFESSCTAYCGLADIHQFPPAEYALRNADAVVTIGCRLDSMLNFGSPPLIPRTAKLVAVSASHDDASQNHAADEVIVGDPAAVVAKLSEASGKGGWSTDSTWLDQNREVRRKWISEVEALLAREASSRPAHPLCTAVALLEALQDGDWFVVDGGDTHYWTEIALNIMESRGKRLGGVLHPGPFSLLGCGVPFGVAVKLRYPEARVVVLSGDGSFLSGGLSVETAFQENAQVIVVVDNNNALGCIAQQQMRVNESGRTYATAFRDVPFHKLFEGLGGHGERIDDAREISAALARAFSSGKPGCIDVRSKSVISPLVAALTDRRSKAAIE